MWDQFYLEGSRVNVLDVVALQGDLLQPQREDILQLVSQDPAVSTEAGIRTRTGRFRSSAQALARELEVKAFQARVVGQQTGQVQVLDLAVDVQLQVPQVGQHPE